MKEILVDDRKYQCNIDSGFVEITDKSGSTVKIDRHAAIAIADCILTEYMISPYELLGILTVEMSDSPIVSEVLKRIRSKER